MSILEDLSELKNTAQVEIAQAASEQDVTELWTKIFGRKNGQLTAILRSVKELPKEERPKVGQAANEVKETIEQSFEKRRGELYQESLQKRLNSEQVDVTLPGRWAEPGRIHLLSSTMRRIKEIFKGLGYSVMRFDKNHEWYRCEQCSEITPFKLRECCPSCESKNIHVMESQEPPVRVICPGKCYRRDAVDATHFWEFHQVEGLLVDEKVTFADLRGTLELFAKAMFGSRRKTRFNPSYFPFTEPSAEVMVDCFVCDGKGCRVCKNSGWIEIMGSGMVHPKVLKGVGYDPERYTGFAFGMGVERIAMLSCNVDDIRLFYEDDLRFLRQF